MAADHHHHQRDVDAENASVAESPTDPAEFWEDFYSDENHPWTGNPNEVLVRGLDGHPAVSGPADALDLGCGSGADAIWLAQRGYTVTAVDISAAALRIGAAAARDAGVAEKITWQQVDLEHDFPAGAWDLVASSYLHSPLGIERGGILGRAASAVRPGGALVIIGHDGVPHWNTDVDPDFSFPTIADVLGELDLGADWTIEKSELVTITIERPEGPVERSDSVVVARRRSS